MTKKSTKTPKKVYRLYFSSFDGLSYTGLSYTSEKEAKAARDKYNQQEGSPYGSYVVR